jgi:hypothetical protein
VERARRIRETDCRDVVITELEIPMRFSGALCAAVFTATVTGVGGAHAAEETICGDFIVFGAVETRAFVDLGETGPSSGDQRVGRYKILDNDGNDIGTMHFSSVLMPPWQADEAPAMTTLHFAFGDGALVATSVIALPAPSDTDIGPDHELHYAITGGTGVFAHATGTLATKTLDDGRRQMAFDLECSR